jgi:hypothetical protein
VLRAIISSRKKALFALTNFSAANFMQTAVGGGELGSAAGFGLAILHRQNVVISGTSQMGGRSYQNYIDQGLGSRFGCLNGSSVFTFSSGYIFTPSDTGKINLFLGVHTGSALRTHMQRARQIGADVPITGFTGATVATELGRYTGVGYRDGDILAMLTWVGMPSQAQLEAFADATRARGDFPDVAGSVYYGARGFNSSNCLKSAAGAGLLGSAAGQWVAWYGVIDVLALANGAVLAENLRVTPSLQGWSLQSTTANYGSLGFTAVNGAAAGVTSATYAATAADIGTPMLFVGVNTGTAVRFFAKRVQVGADVPISGYIAPVAQPTVIGSRQDGTFPASNTRWLGTAGGDGVVPTLAEILQLFDDVERTGQIQGIPGKTTRLWNPNIDVLPGSIVVPAQVLDRVGTDHLTRVGIAVQTDANSIRAVGPYGAADGWQTAPGGGIQGQNAGFHAVIDVWLTKVPTAIECPLHCGNLAGSAGWILQANSAALRFGCPGSTLTSSYTLTGADLNKRTRIVINKTPTVIQLFVNGVQVGADVASTFVVLANAVMGVGQILGAQNFSSGYVECVAGGNVALSPANIATYCADLTQAPPTIPGVTLKRYVFEQDIAAASGALPVTSVERISGGDSLTRTGNPLLPAVLGMVVTHRWSTKDELANVPNPVGRKTYGARAFSAGNLLTTANGAGIRGAAGGFHVEAHVRFDSIPVSGSQSIVSTADAGSSGFAIQLVSAALRFFVTNGSFTISASYTLTAQDLGVPLVVTGHYTGAGVRLYVGKAQVSADVVGTTFAVAGVGVPMQIGAWSAQSQYFSAGTVLGVQGGLGNPSAAQVAQCADATELAGVLQPITGLTDHRWILGEIVSEAAGVPATYADKVGSDIVSKVGVLELGIDVAKAPAAPTQLTDTQTRAAADALLRVGNPQVRTIDPTIDGRRTLGAQGFNANNRLMTAPGAPGMAGDVAQWKAWYGRLDSAPVGATLFECVQLSPLRGWTFETNAAPWVRFHVFNNGVANPSAQYIPSAATYGRPVLLVGVTTGSVARLYADDGSGLVQVGADVTSTGYVAPVGARGMIGGREDGTLPTPFASAFGVAGGNAAPTFAELQQFAADVRTTGRMPTIPIAGKTAFSHDLTTDILASGVDAVPAVVLDRVGTDHLIRVGMDVHTGPNAIRGVGPFSLNDGFTSAIGGGIQGANSGFNVEFDLVLTRVPTTATQLVNTTTTNAGQGWYCEVTSTGLLRTALGGGAVSSTYQLTSGDLNKRLRVTINKTAAVLQLFVLGVQAGADAAAASYTVPATGRMGIGLIQGLGSAPFVDGWIEFVQGGLGSLTLGEVATLNADLTQAPPVVAGKTDRRWCLEQDIAAASGTLPAKSVERASGGDDLMRVGSGLTLAQRTERVWSYETGLIWQGISGASGTAFYSTPNGLAGDPAGFGGIWIGTFDSQAVASVTRVLCGKRTSGTKGWHLATGGTNSFLQFNVGSATSTASTSTAAIAASEVGKLFIVGFWYDGTKAHMFVRRAEVGTGSAALTGIYAPETADMTLGKRSDGSPADGTSFRGFIELVGVPSLAEFQAIHDAILAQETIVEMPGRTFGLYDTTKDVVAAGNTVPAALVDRKNGDNATKQGAPTLGTSYTRVAA